RSAVRHTLSADADMRGPGWLREPLPRRRNIGHPLAAGENAAFLDAALRAEFARAVTVRQQHRMAGLQQLLRPVAVARQYRLGMAAQAAAGMQCDHGGKWAGAVRLVVMRMQGQAGRGNVDV